MWRNYLTIGFRSLLRDPVSAGINLIGLVVGIAGCLMIILFIRHQLSFDQWLPDAERTYQFQRVSTSGGDSGRRMAGTAYVAATLMPPQFPEIEATTGLIWGAPDFRKDGQVVRLRNTYWTDENFFRVLRLPLLHGDPATALAAVDTIVLTESSAVQLFGTTNVVGRTVEQVTSNGDHLLRVTGVLRDLPENTHLRIGAIYRRNVDPDAAGNEAAKRTHWTEISGWVYARLRAGADVGRINARMPTVLRRLVPRDQQDESAADGLGFTEELTNVRALNTQRIDSGTMKRGTPAKTLVTFAIVAAFLLLVACVNFVNLSTAQAGRRAREIALRKSLGATRRQIASQFLVEAAITTAVAGILALALVEFSLPAMNALIDSSIELNYFGAQGIALPFLLLLVVVALLSGAYPAFFLSGYQAAAVLKANKGSVEAEGTGRLRTALVVVQFAVSIALIVCTLVIYAQTLFARSADPGYRVSGLLYILNPDKLGDRQQIETFMRRVSGLEGVSGVTRVGITPDSNSTSTRTFRAPGATESVSIQIVPVDGATFGALGMRLLAGRTVTDTREADLGAAMYGLDPARDELVQQRGLNVVLDESAVRTFGFADPRAAIGRQIVPDADEGEQAAAFTIVGIVNDARFESMRLDSLPKLYFVAPTSHLSLAVRFERSDGAALRSQIESLWNASRADAPFDAFFADERIARMYEADERRARLFAVFAGLAVFVSCLGLYGLAAFAAQRRTKEIGIRKVLGARSRDIVRLLVWQFTRPVLLANLIAWPVAWWAMRNWLSEFEARIDLGPGPFLFASLVALAIAAATTIGHALRVARRNPVHALRYE